MHAFFQTARPRCGDLIKCAWLGLSLVTSAGESPPSTETISVLTNIVQIRELSAVQASAGQPVRVRGVVTYYDQKWQLFVEDKTGGCYVYPTDAQGQRRNYAIKAGDFVEVEGQSAPGDFTPSIRNAKFRVLGREALPHARELSVGDLSTGRVDAEWVEVRGIVHSAKYAEGSLVLELVTGRNRTSAYVITGDTNGLKWIDTEVRVRGVCAVKLNARKQLVSAHLQVPGPEHLLVVEPAPDGRGASAIQPISSLMAYTPHSASGHRVRVRGVVTLAPAPRVIYLKDETGGLCLRLQTEISVSPGDLIEATGFPLTGDYTPVLEESVAQLVGHGPVPTPVELTAQQLKDGEHDADLIRLKAQVLDHRRKGLEQTFILRMGDLVFNAVVIDRNSRREANELAPGSLVTVAGVCQIQVNERDERIIQLLVASARDVQVLRRAGWWSSGRLAWTLGLTSGVLILTLAWGLVLARANRSLEMARAEFSDLYDNAPVGYQEIDHTGRITRVNKKELSMLGYARSDQVQGRFLWDLVTGDHLRPLLQEALAGNPSLFAFEESFRCHDGSLLPVWLEYQLIRDANGKIRGARSTLQDISKLKNAQAELEQARVELEQRVRERTAELANTNTYLQEEIVTRQQAQADSEELHKQLMETSRLAGKAEVATNVLHNVGNVLNSVNVSCTLVANILRNSKSGGLAKAVSMLEEHKADLSAYTQTDPKGRLVLGYLGRLAEHLANEQSDGLKELSGLEKNIDHIKDIVAMQQGFARVSGVVENLNVTELVEDAMRMNLSSLSRHEILVVKEFSAAPRVTVEKHKVLQILVNLVRNAKQACNESRASDKRLTLRVGQADGRVQISVADNGIGIPPENISRIFGHGFTTKKNGHGFGLHSGALAAKELGGSLKVHSDGAGRGAVFTLELPVGSAGGGYAG